MIMKIRFLFSVVMYCNVCCAQSSDANESLDRYFAGIPLRESYEKWVHYIFNHPYLGVDSLSDRGGFSSFKPGIKDHFPFSDFIPVKILFQKTIYYDSVTNKSTDSTNEVSIEGIFPGNKTGRKESLKVFTELRKALRRHYGAEDMAYYEEPDGEGSAFSRGRKDGFPSCSLQQGYSKELAFYFVMITYTSQRKNESN